MAVPIYEYNAAGGYDTNGNVLGYTDTVMGAWSFGYDQLNRLVMAANGGALLPNTAVVPAPNWAANFCWAYDAFGNRTQQGNSDQPFAAGESSSCTFTGTAYQNTWASYSAQNQMTGTNASGNSVAPSYDAAGDVASDGKNAYLYDAEGRICAEQDVYGQGQMTGYLYDAAGNRVAKGNISTMSCDITTNGFQQTAGYVVGASGEQLTEIDGNNNWKHTNVYAGGKQIGTYDSAGLHFYFDDPLGTRRAQANSSGVLEAVYQSLPFGDGLNQIPYVTGVTDPTENHFTGKERDTESGNDFFGARYYNSATGRWLSPDWSVKVQPVPYAKLDNPQSLNLYSYVLNNPMSKIDPDGHCDSSAGATARTKCQAVKNLKTSDYGRGHIQSEETRARQPGKPDITVYPDGANLPTVGYGHQVVKTDNLKMGDKIKPEQAEAWFNANVATAEKAVTGAASKTNTQLSQGEYDALVDLAYNAAGSLTTAKSPKLMDAMGKSDYNGMSEQLQYTKDVKGNTESGLGPRSDQREQIFKGEEP